MRPWQTKLADGKPVTWIPHPVLLLAPFFAAMVSTAAFPYVTESRLVSLFVAVPVAATFAPLVLLGSNVRTADDSCTRDYLTDTSRSYRSVLAQFTQVSIMPIMLPYLYSALQHAPHFHSM